MNKAIDGQHNPILALRSVRRSLALQGFCNSINVVMCVAGYLNFAP